jgi:Bacterial Ig domain
MRRSTPVFFALLLLLAAPAYASSNFPGRLDNSCRSQGRTPPNPAALARASGAPYADCALCHNFDISRGGFPSSGNVGPNGTQYKRGNLDPFCVLAPVNHAPVLAPIGNQMVDVGQPLGLLLSASDSDGDPVAFSATGVPNGAVFMDAGNGMATFNWTPTQAGNTTVTFRVTDGMASDSEQIVITVGSVNAPPVLAPIGNHSVMVGDTLTLAISAMDPEGGPLSFVAMGPPVGASFQDFGDGTAELVFMPSAATVANVTVTVTDAGTPPESASESFTLTALDPGAPEGPTLEFARWDFWGEALSLMGSGAEPKSMVTIVEAASEGELAVVRAAKDGSFALDARTFLAPCSVRARSADGVLGSTIFVMNAPADCGTRLLTRAKPRWKCKNGMLTLRISRAPLEAGLGVVDAATGTMLMQSQADERGRSSLGIHTRTGPASIRVQLSSGAGNWTLGPVPVSGKACSGDESRD